MVVQSKTVQVKKRERRFNLIVGSPGSGKSTWIAERVKNYNGNVLVWKHFGNYDDPAFDFLPIKTSTNWRQGAVPGQPVKFRMIGDEDTYPKLLQWLYGKDPNKFKQGLVIIDDCTLFEADKISKNLKRLIAMRRHKNYLSDIWLVYHGLTNLPIDQFSFVNNVVMFNTTDKADYKKSKIPLEALQYAIDGAKANFLRPETRYTPVIIRLS